MIKKLTLTTASVLFLGAALLGASPVFAAAPKIEKLFYYVPGFATFNSFEANAKNVDLFAPQVYRVDGEGNLTGSISDVAQEVIDTNKTKVMPLVANEDFDPFVMHAIIDTTAMEDSVIAQLITEAKAGHYVGWQFDFEHIYAEDRDAYSAFVERAAKQLHARGLKLSVAVVGRTSDDPADLPEGSWENWAGVYDYARIGKAADFVSVMAYDEPASKGPVASLPWVKKVLAYAEKKISKSKISLGVSVYGWLWDADTGKRLQTVPYGKVADLIANKTYTGKGFDATAQAGWITYSEGTGSARRNYKIWYEDVRSWKAKLALAKAQGLRGISVWVLGMEDPATWKNLK